MNNDAINAILARRSIRKYEGKPVEREKIDRILECACAAPSANNRRPWHFVEITERKTLDALAGAHPYGKMLTQATLAIAVCCSKEESSQNPWWEQDCAAAMQNILVGATALGLGSVWLGVCHDSVISGNVRKIVEIPESIHVMGIAAVGYGAEFKKARSGIYMDHVHKERW